MFMLGLNEAIDRLAMANSDRWHGHVLRREDSHVLRREDGHVLRKEDGHVLRREDGHMMRREDGHMLRRALVFEVEGQRKKGRLKNTWEMQIEDECVMVGSEKGR